MSSVTGRIAEIKQPYGGYLKPSEFRVTDLDDGITLNDTENLSGSSIGSTVDYLARFLSGTPFQEAFKIPLSGLKYALKYNARIVSEQEYKALTTEITGLDDKSVIYACKLASFDIWSRDQSRAKQLAIGQSSPDTATIQNIQTMTKRTLTFFEKYGPIVEHGFRFDPASEQITLEDGSIGYNLAPYYDMMAERKGSYGGYTPTVEAGEGDYLTKDTIWELKVVKSRLTSQVTLQLLMYWIMGLNSKQKNFMNIRYLGVFNPRLNKVYLYDLASISQETVRTVSKEVMCYE